MLNTQQPWAECDDFYQGLIESHHGLDEPASHALNARLILLLAQHVRDLDVLRAALAAARRADMATSA